MRRAEFVERVAGILGIGELAQHRRRVGRRLRQLDVVLADAGVGEAAGLQVAGKGEHGLGELELGFGLRVGAARRQIGQLVVLEIEPVGVGLLEAGDRPPWRARSRCPCRTRADEIAVLVERLDRGALLLAGENLVGLGGEQVAHLFGDRPVGGIERGERIDHRGRLGRVRGSRRGFHGRGRRLCGGGLRGRRRGRGVLRGSDGAAGFLAVSSAGAAGFTLSAPLAALPARASGRARPAARRAPAPTPCPPEFGHNGAAAHRTFSPKLPCGTRVDGGPDAQIHPRRAMATKLEPAGRSNRRRPSSKTNLANFGALSPAYNVLQLSQRFFATCHPFTTGSIRPVSSVLPASSPSESSLR